jgi:hypothetical protein
MVIGNIAKRRQTGSELNEEPEEPGQDYLHAVQTYYRHRGFREVEAPRFEDSRPMKLAR